MQLNIGRAIAAIAVSMLATNALADDRGLYLGLGATRIEADDSVLSDSDNTYKAYLGYRPGGMFAFEGAVVDFGELRDDGHKLDGRSLQGAVHAGFPIGQRLRAYGSLGGHMWDADGDAAGSDNGVGLTYGGGVEFDLLGNLGVRAEYEILKLEDVDLQQSTLSAFLLF
ncbi:outer membrane beta-barrel protein [Pseudomonas sp. QL9]|uniref:outer membrane beta-barrel protein n=1 Tax=Pseudomonas sp. QL9 TaxID=3242725 RepID=UPI00352B9A00